MITFRYRALAEDGRRVRGELDATDLAEPARSDLRESLERMLQALDAPAPATRDAVT